MFDVDACVTWLRRSSKNPQNGPAELARLKSELARACAEITTLRKQTGLFTRQLQLYRERESGKRRITRFRRGWKFCKRTVRGLFANKLIKELENKSDYINPELCEDINDPSVLKYADEPILKYDSLRQRATTLPASPRILVLKLDHIGDFILAIEPFAAIRRYWPNAHITLVCGPWGVPLAERLGYFDVVVPCVFFPPTSADWVGDVSQGMTNFLSLDLGAFDIAIDLRHDPDTRVLLPLIDARFRVGFVADSETACLDLALPSCEPNKDVGQVWPALDAISRLMLLVDAAGGVFARPPAASAHALATDAAFDFEFGGRPVVAVAPGAGRPIRKWPVDRLAAVSAALVDRLGCAIVVIGGASDHNDAEQIAASLPRDRCLNLTGKIELLRLPDVLKAVTLFIGNDSGPTHLAARLGVPTVQICCGVSDVDIWHVSGPAVAVLRVPVTCAPCRLERAELCPYEVKCLTLIEASAVIDAATELLRTTGFEVMPAHDSVCNGAG